MPDLSMVFDLLARDRASAAVGKVGDSMKKAGDQGTKFGGLLKGGIAVAAGALAGAGLVGMFTGLYDAAAESAKVTKLTENVIKTTGAAAGITADQVGDLATSLSNKTGMDDEAIQSAENLLLTFTNVRNEAGKGNDVFSQTTGLALDMSTALGTDASGAAMQLGKALNDPIKGVGALSRSGVSFTAQQKEQIKTLVASGKTLEAQKIILGEVGKEFGGAAAAAATPMDRLKVTAGNLQEMIGGKLIPVFDKVSGVAAQALGVLFSGDFTGGPLSEDSPIIGGLFSIRESAEKVGKWVREKLMPELQKLGKYVVTVLAPKVVDLARKLTAVVVPAFAAVGRVAFATVAFFVKHQTAAKVLGVIVAAVLTAVVAAWVAQAVAAARNSARTVIAWFATATASSASAATQKRSTAQMVVGWALSAAKAALGAARVVAGWVLMGVQSMLQAARMAAAWFIALGPLGWVTAAVIAIVALIVANWGRVKSFTSSAWKAVGKAVGAAGSAIKSAVKAALKFVVNLFLNFTGPGLIIKHWQTIKDKTRAAFDAVVGAVSGAFRSVKSAISDGIGAAVSFVSDLPGRIMRGIGNMASTLYSAGTDLIQGLINGAGSMLRKIGSFFLDMVPGWIRGPFKKALGINSPSTVFAEYGSNIGDGLIVGLAGSSGAVQGAVGQLADALTTGDEFRGVGEQMGQGLADGISAMRPVVASELAALADSQAFGALQASAGVGSGPSRTGGLGYRPPRYDRPAAVPAAPAGATYSTTISGVASPEQVAAEVLRAQRTAEFLAGAGS